MRTGKKIPAVEFSKGNLCSRCGIFGEKKVCDKCKDLKNCSVCEIVLRGKKYDFYQYDYVQMPGKSDGRFYREIRKPQMNCYTHDGFTCDDCRDYKSRIKNVCWACDDFFRNSATRFKKYGNLCKECTGENYEEEMKNAVRIIGEGLGLQIILE